MIDSKARRNWREVTRALIHPRVVTMLFLGFSAGIPILLIFSSLSLWLREAGVERAAVTFFSWAALGYSFKFVWAPLVDRLPLPVLSRLLGRRRAWMLLAQLAIMTAIGWMALTDPAGGESQLTLMAFAAVLLGFSSATQDIVIDAYRIESAGQELQALMSSAYIMGYRIGMLVAGAGALFLASYLGSEKGVYSYQAWLWTYFAMAATMMVGVITTLLIPEPKLQRAPQADHSVSEQLRFLLLFLFAVCSFIFIFYISRGVAAKATSGLTQALGNRALAGFLVELLRLSLALAAAALSALLLIRLRLVRLATVRETYIDPIQDYFKRYGVHLAWLLLALIGIYRISDIVLGVISNVFYQDLGFSKIEIATIVKTFGLFMTIAGGFLGGVLSLQFGVLRILFLGALLSAATNLLFMLLAQSGNDIVLLYIVISADNLSAGLASAAFVAFLSSLTNIRFTAMQYAIFSSLMTLLPKVLGGYSGSIVDAMGYSSFFLLSAVIGIPVLFLVGYAGRAFSLQQKGE